MFGSSDQNSQGAAQTNSTQSNSGAVLPSSDNITATSANSTAASESASAFPPSQDNNSSDPFGTTPLATEQNSTTPSGTNQQSNSNAYAAPSASEPTSNNLQDIKKQAIESLSPIVDQLNQSPVDKFKTTMMMIQTTDNQSLIKPAYEAAKLIEDEKERAQALLDIVNEINYFTQNQYN